MADKPITLADLSHQDALRYTVGEYIEVFSTLETTLSAAMCLLTGLAIEKIQFMWKDVFISQKIKTARRLAKERFGDEGPEWLSLKPTLNDIENSLEFRNELAHGSFVLFTDEGLKLGKAGQSWSKLFHGLEKIDYKAIQTETQKLVALQVRLAQWLTNPTGK